MMRCYLFDLDGTLADGDAPIPHMIELARALDTRETPVVLVSGRSDRVRTKTDNWLERHGVHGCPLYMRKDGDNRPNHVVMAELLDQIRADGYAPIMAFDDHNVEMWRAKGIPCAQVAAEMSDGT